MRHRQRRIVSHQIPKQHEIEIQRSCRSGKRPFAAALALDRQQDVEQLARGHRGFTDRGRIQERRLLSRHIDWIGFAIAGYAKISED